MKIQLVNNPMVVSCSKDVDLCDFRSRRLPNSVDQTVKWWYYKTVVCRNLKCSIKEGRKQSHPRSKVASTKMSSNLKKNCTWCTPAPVKSSGTKDKTSPAVNCSKPPYWSDLDKKDEEKMSREKWQLHALPRTVHLPGWY